MIFCNLKSAKDRKPRKKGPRTQEMHGPVQGKGARRYGSRSWEVREKREVREPELGGAGEEREV